MFYFSQILELLPLPLGHSQAPNVPGVLNRTLCRAAGRHAMHSAPCGRLGITQGRWVSSRPSATRTAATGSACSITSPSVALTLSTGTGTMVGTQPTFLCSRVQPCGWYRVNATLSPALLGWPLHHAAVMGDPEAIIWPSVPECCYGEVLSWPPDLNLEHSSGEPLCFSTSPCTLSRACCRVPCAQASDEWRSWTSMCTTATAPRHASAPWSRAS